MNEQKLFSAVVEDWKAYKRQYVKKSSFAAYALLIENHLLPSFGKCVSIEESSVQAFVLNKLEGGLGQKTVKDALIVLKMILKYGAKQGKLAYQPFEVQFPTQRLKSSLEVLSRAEQKKIMGYIQQHFTFRNLGVYICLSAGMRIGEICALKWKDVDMEKGVITVRRTIQRIYTIESNFRRTELVLDTPKTSNSVREIPMVRDLWRMLKPLKKLVNESFFVLTNDSKPTEPRTYRSYYKSLMRELSMPELKFHGLRHSFATRCIESKCDYKTVSVLLGHSNISTTLNLYVHPNMEQKKRAVEQMFKSLK